MKNKKAAILALQLIAKRESLIKYSVYYGEYLHDLDRDRCPSANSKFTLFARIRELIDFINHYKPERS